MKSFLAAFLIFSSSLAAANTCPLIQDSKQTRNHPYAGALPLFILIFGSSRLNWNIAAKEFASSKEELMNLHERLLQQVIEPQSKVFEMADDPLLQASTAAFLEVAREFLNSSATLAPRKAEHSGAVLRERILTLSPTRTKEIASQLKRTPGEVNLLENDMKYALWARAYRLLCESHAELPPSRLTYAFVLSLLDKMRGEQQTKSGVDSIRKSFY